MPDTTDTAIGTGEQAGQASPNGDGPGQGSEVEGYGAAAPLYVERGWTCVLPLSPGSKFPPPKGYTGKDGTVPTPEQIAKWARTKPNGNIALRLPDTLVGIDVDAYGDKTGGRTLTEAQARWGVLPPTVRSTSRDDGVSGIRLYRVPGGTVLPGVIKLVLADGTVIGDIEIVQHHHRYVIVRPSIHPEGHLYQWLDEHDQPADIPAADALPELPAGWLEGLAELAPSTDRAAEGDPAVSGGTETEGGTETDTEADPAAVVGAALTDGPMSATVLKRFTQAAAACHGASRHDTVRDDVLALMRYGEQGEPGVRSALLGLCSIFVDAVAEDRTGGQAEALAEFHSMMNGAGHLLAGSPTPEPVTVNLPGDEGTDWSHPPGDQGGDIDDDTDDPAGDETGRAALTLPQKFWTRHERLQLLHDLCLSKTAPPDATLGAALARLSAHMPPKVRIYTGARFPLPLNLNVIVTTVTGKGKSTASRASKALIEFTLDWSDDPMESPVRAAAGDIDFPKTAKLKTGEGLVEAYYGKVRKNVGTSANGNPVYKMMREVVRSNVFAENDEGATVVKWLNDEKQTLDDTMREMFSECSPGPASPTRRGHAC